jgi:hypothetical protein
MLLEGEGEEQVSGERGGKKMNKGEGEVVRERGRWRSMVRVTVVLYILVT